MSQTELAVPPVTVNPQSKRHIQCDCVSAYSSVSVCQTQQHCFVLTMPRCHGHVKILGRWYKFVKSREIKTVTVKRDAECNLWVCFSVDTERLIERRTSTGESDGFDFGLKTFLTDNSGKTYMHPQFFKAGLDRIRVLNRLVSRKQPGSKNRKKAKRLLARAHRRIADKRREFYFRWHANCAKILMPSILKI